MTECKEKKGDAPCVSFTTFVMSLSTAALQHLGESLSIQGENQEEACVNLALARQTIDILEMIEQKTQGNLSEAEGKLLVNILYDLRMRYVKAAQETSC